MKSKIKQIFINLYCFVFWLAYWGASQEEKKKIDMDISRYDEKSLAMVLFHNMNSRNVFYYRISNQKLVKICKVLLKPNPNIEIHVKSGKIGGGLRLFHNYGCVISAESMGDNCTVLQGVTIGNGKENPETHLSNPIIGNNVCIHANAVVFGGIIVGDNVKIGANATVYKNVPENATVVGTSKIV